MRLLLPYLLAGLGAKVSADYHAATMMIVTLLASKATLSEGLLAGMPVHPGAETIHTLPSCSAGDEHIHQQRKYASSCAVFSLYSLKHCIALIYMPACLTLPYSPLLYSV